MTAHLEKTPVPPNQINPNLPVFLCQAIERSLAKNPAQRFQSAEEFRAALNSGEAINGVVVSPAAFAETLIMPPQSNAPSGSSSKPSRITAPASTTSPEEVTKLLAVHIGPVAKFVVKKLSAQCSSADQLYAAAAKEIPTTEARNQFLRSRRR
jgi:serine/threonine-protein kinase